MISLSLSLLLLSYHYHCVALLDFFAKAQEARGLIKNCELNLYVSRDGLSHWTKIIISSGAITCWIDKFMIWVSGSETSRMDSLMTVIGIWS